MNQELPGLLVYLLFMDDSPDLLQNVLRSATRGAFNTINL
jgi:hypothetical protein